MSIPVSDIFQAYRNTPEKTEEALQKVSSHLQYYRKPGERMMTRNNLTLFVCIYADPGLFIQEQSETVCNG